MATNFHHKIKVKKKKNKIEIITHTHNQPPQIHYNNNI